MLDLSFTTDGSNVEYGGSDMQKRGKQLRKVRKALRYLRRIGDTLLRSSVDDN